MQTGRYWHSLQRGCLKDRRDPARIDHDLVAVLWLRSDPVFKLAVGRLPESGNAVCSHIFVLGESVLDQVADRHQADEPLMADDRQMANPIRW